MSKKMNITYLVTLWSLLINTFWNISTVCSQQVAVDQLFDEFDALCDDEDDLPAIGVEDAFKSSFGAVPSDAICINQADFDKGTFIISTPGSYKLCEDIVFDPNAPPPGQVPPEDVYDPVFDGNYDENAFALGFFAAIAIAAPNVDLYLNSHTLEQSRGHALMQRFFALIELADSPFITKVGPAEFVGNGTFVPASNVRILGPGTLGLSAHHGVHGNENSDVAISGVTFKDFEVAAVSLNNVDNLLIDDCTIVQNRHDVPIVGLFSAARFIRPYAKVLAEEHDYEMPLRGETVKASVLYDNLINSINNVYQDVLNDGFIDKTTHPMEYELFHNPNTVIDGPCYAILVNGKGPAINGIGFVFNETDPTVTSSNVVIRNNRIGNIDCWNNEVPAAMVERSPGEFVAATDVRGSVLQLVSSYDKENPQRAINADGTYRGNAVADVQMMVAHAIHEGVLVNDNVMQIASNTINRELVQWAQGLGEGHDYYTPEYFCNGDSMFHVMKGIIAIRVEETRGFSIEDNTIMGVTSLSFPPYENCAGLHPGSSIENVLERQGGNIRGISVAAVRGYGEIMSESSLIENNILREFASEYGHSVIGIDVQGDSSWVSIRDNTVDLAIEAPILTAKHATTVVVTVQMPNQLCALRIRSHAHLIDAPVDGNYLAQDYIIEPRQTSSNSSTKSLPPGHLDGRQLLGWQHGGCPFYKR